MRRRFDVLMVWSIDRLGRSVLHVANALAELDAAGVALYSGQQAIDSTAPMRRAMHLGGIHLRRAGTGNHSQVLAGCDRVRDQGERGGGATRVAAGVGGHQEPPQKGGSGLCGGWGFGDCE